MNLSRKTIKKTVAAFTLAASLTISVPMAFADTPATHAYTSADAPSTKDTSTITVKGVEPNCKVTAYQIVEGTYNSYGLTGFRQNALSKQITTLDMTTTENEKTHVWEYNQIPKSFNIYKLTQAINTNTKDLKTSLPSITLTYNELTKTYSSNQAHAGSYLILVESENGNNYEKGVSANVYNPMWISVNYTDAVLKSSVTGGDVTATFNTIKLADGNAYAKKSQTYFTKDIVNPSTGDTKVDDERVGDTVTFDLKTIIPDYSDGFKPADITFKITDRQSVGLDVVKAENVNVYLGEVTANNLLDRSKYTVTVSDKNVKETTNNFVVDFDKAWIQSNPNQNIIVRYSTTINEKAVLANNSNPNTADLEYTTVYGETTILKDKTRHYTFQVNAKKLDEKGNALSGATFELSQVSENNTYGAGKLDKDSVVYTKMSDTEGMLSFTGLEEGEYVLREIIAPEGYTLNDSTWKIVITPSYDSSKKIIEKYSVEITEQYVNGQVGATRIYNYSVKSQEDAADGLSDTITLVESVDPATAIVDISNTRLSKLPSVGGNGTMALAIGSMALVGGALTMTLVAKKKDEA